MRMRRFDSRAPDFAARFRELAASEVEWDLDMERDVRAILARVRAEGDAALVELTARLDRHVVESAQELVVGPDRVEAAWARLPVAERDALEAAARRIRDYHERQRIESWQATDEHGNVLGQHVTALDRVGMYVPGGKAAYPSSVLMNAIPAKVAGVAEVVMTVPAPGGALNDAVLGAARVAGVGRIITVGGAQAVGALAYGTGVVPAVDKIVGPGNAWVAMAKRLVFGTVGIDMIAGPSEIVVVCDGHTPAEWIAVDLFSQAEHDEDARAILLCPDDAYLDAVQAEVERLLPTMERSQIIATSLSERGALVRVRDLEEAVELVNQLAPEHLELSVEAPDALLPRLRHAGAVFLGRHTPEALGDYCAGPNHVLPTARTARFSSPLGVYDFQKRTSLIGCSPGGAIPLARVASVLARREALTAHARSAELRIEAGNGPARADGDSR
ncbi:MAG: histidinol dehydrogenase [Ectothiorhodospiraceae bacterium]|nr:histidinol dehydrogenase [Ectothiorhodospiraceae bacterium]